MNGTLFFAASDGVHGIELWKSNGTLAGTTMVKDINPSGSNSSVLDTDPGGMVSMNGKAFFTATNGQNGIELWTSDGTATGTKMVKDIVSGGGSSAPRELTVAGGKLFFRAFTALHGEELWRSDGTGAGTTRLRDIYQGPTSSSPTELTEVGGKLFFQANDGSRGREPWKSDGTATGTTMVSNIAPNPAARILRTSPTSGESRSSSLTTSQQRPGALAQ